jgi:hypothetical protein
VERNSGCNPTEEEHVAEEKVTNTFFKGHVARGRRYERSFGNCVNREMIFSVYLDRKGDDSFTARFEVDVMGNDPLQVQVIGEVVTNQSSGHRWGCLIDV